MDHLTTQAHELPSRFRSKIEALTECGCWIWMGATDECGYGRVKFEGSNRKVHRVIYEMMMSPLEEGITIDHKCRVRCCVNPDHFDLVSPGENTRRGNVTRFANPAARQRLAALVKARMESRS
jgi:hypothetical protein